MNGLYLLLDGLTVLFPLLLSFDKKVAYVRHWKNVLLAAAIVAVPFLIWDILFTARGIWGFNPKYLVGAYLFNLPVEEVLFFLFVPFSCLFIYACVKAYFPQLRVFWINAFFYGALLCYVGFVAYVAFFTNGAYSRAVIVSTLLTLTVLIVCKRLMRSFPLAFLLSLLPFLLVNGILTGGFTREPVVWYDPSERLPFSMYTIPAEDILYCFSLMGLNTVAYELIARRNRSL